MRHEWRSLTTCADSKHPTFFLDSFQSHQMNFGSPQDFHVKICPNPTTFCILANVCSSTKLCEFLFVRRVGSAGPAICTGGSSKKFQKKYIGASKKITGHGVKGPVCGCQASNGQAKSLFFVLFVPVKKKVTKNENGFSTGKKQADESTSGPK